MQATLPPSNESLTESMIAQGAISSRSIINAFEQTDRAHFLQRPEYQSMSEDIDDVYQDMPLRHGIVHLSAPSIYGVALEALELEQGNTFLNVGSGTGCACMHSNIHESHQNPDVTPSPTSEPEKRHLLAPLSNVCTPARSCTDLSSLAACIIGRRAIQFGIECREELIQHSRSRLDELGHTHVQLVHANCFELDPESSMRFQRIYVGAGASQRTASILFRMLEIGGIIVGPFSGAHGNQRLLRARRIGEAKFEVSEVLSVQFTPMSTHKHAGRITGLKRTTCGPSHLSTSSPCAHLCACYPLPPLPLPSLPP